MKKQAITNPNQRARIDFDAAIILRDSIARDNSYFWDMNKDPELFKGDWNLPSYSILSEAMVALKQIAKWELPDTDKEWESGEPVSYEAEYGSEGAKRYMRKLAKCVVDLEESRIEIEENVQRGWLLLSSFHGSIRNPNLYQGQWKPVFKTSYRGFYLPNEKGDTLWTDLASEARKNNEVLMIFGIDVEKLITEGDMSVLDDLREKIDQFIFEYLTTK